MPDGYYFSFNMFGATGLYVNAILCAAERVKMLAGDPSAGVACTPGIPNMFSILPYDLEGTTTPVVSPGNGFVTYDWFFLNFPPYSLQIFRGIPNYSTGILTTTSVQAISTGALLGPCGDAGGACVPQPTTAVKLDSLAARLLYRASYRNRGGVDSLLLTVATDPDAGGPKVDHLLLPSEWVSKFLLRILCFCIGRSDYLVRNWNTIVYPNIIAKVRWVDWVVAMRKC
jgi:hypothetical protein